MNKRAGTEHIHEILIGYHGSKQAQRALGVGLRLAQSMHSNVEVLAVAQPPASSSLVQSHAVLESARKRYGRALQRISARAKENGIHLKTEIVVGHPAEQIIRKAEQSHAELIVVGGRSGSRSGDLVAGSVSERVLHYAPCAVLVTAEVANGNRVS